MAKRRGFNKYQARSVVYKGIKFDSTHERDYYILLCHRQRHGEISGLRLQTPFILIPQTTKLVPKQLKTKIRYDRKVVEQDAGYHNDFSFYDTQAGVYVCCEYKSEMTAELPDYVLRRKLMVRKIYEHNAKGRSRWIFREVVYHKNGSLTITDK